MAQVPTHQANGACAGCLVLYSLAQLTAMVRVPGPEDRLVQAQVFSYRSLLTFKLMRESPLAYRETLRIMRRAISYSIFPCNSRRQLL